MKKLLFLLPLLLLVGYVVCSDFYDRPAVSPARTPPVVHSVVPAAAQNSFASHPVEARRYVHRMDTVHNDSLLLLFPRFTSIDLAVERMPSPEDTSAIFVCSASFTGELLDTFRHSNIAGNHVSAGKFHHGFKCKPNTGGFVYGDGVWKFCMPLTDAQLKKAAQQGGMGFAQNMIIYNGETQPSFRKLSSCFVYRALCEWKGQLCIAESRKVMKYSHFIESLQQLGVTHALYLDMGSGWNHAWLRDNFGGVHILHPKHHRYCTNWLLFRR